MVELLLDTSSQMHAMEEYVTRHEQADHNQALRDDAVRRSSLRLTARHVGRSLEITLREKDGHIPETVRRKLAHRLKQSPLLMESATDESKSKDVSRCRKHRNTLKSCICES